jgi:hypothetical protein
MNKISFKKSAFALIAAGTLMAPSVQANLALNWNTANYYHGDYTPNNSGDLIYQFDNNGNCGGVLQNSYTCASSLTHINYSGGNSGQGSCLVLKDNRGGCYVWNISNWNGTDQIDCNVYTGNYGCHDIKIFGNCTPPAPNNVPTVPEPSTVVAAALLLLPFGISTVRILRKNKLS